MENLIFWARKGDSEAITILYKHTYSKVYYAVRSMIKDEDAIFDIVQDTYVKAFTHLDQFEGTDGFVSWVKQIAANTSRDWLKKKRPLLFSELDNDEDENAAFDEQMVDDRIENLPEQVIEQEETARLIREILEGLPEDQRAVIGMYYYEGLHVKTIAQLMNTTESAVKSRLLYGRKKIEKKVMELEKKGTKLYSLAPIPFLLLLFRNEKAYAAELPDAKIQNAILEKTAFKTASVNLENKDNPRTHKIEKKSSLSSNGAAMAGQAGKSGILLGGASAVKIGAVVVMAVTFIGGGIFGISRLSNKSDKTEEKTAPNQEVIESVVASKESAVETIMESETEIAREEFLEIYSELISNAESYDYQCGEAKPTGIYRYALVTLEEGDDIPALLISQEADNYMEYVRVFLYDADSNVVLQPTDSLLQGAARMGGYRGWLSTGEEHTQLQISEASFGTGDVDVSRILVSGDKLIYEPIGSGSVGQDIAGVTSEDIEWFDITDLTGISAFSISSKSVSEENVEETNEPKVEVEDAFPEDGDRLVLAGTVEIMNYDEAVELQGYPDYNEEDPGQTWVIIRLDSPQMLEGTQDISTWQAEHSVVLVSNSIRVSMGLQENVLKDDVGKHIIFSAGSYHKASDTSVPIGIPWADDIHVLKVID